MDKVKKDLLDKDQSVSQSLHPSSLPVTTNELSHTVNFAEDCNSVVETLSVKGPREDLFFEDSSRGHRKNENTLRMKLSKFMERFWLDELDFVTISEEKEKVRLSRSLSTELKQKYKLQSGFTRAFNNLKSSRKKKMSMIQEKENQRRIFMRSNLSFIPLQFIDKELELEFAFNNNRVFKYRAALVALILFILIVLELTFVAVGTAQSKHFQSEMSVATIVYVIHASIMGSYILLFFSGWISFLKLRMELFTVLVLSINIFLAIWIAVWAKFTLFWNHDSNYSKIMNSFGSINQSNIGSYSDDILKSFDKAQYLTLLYFLVNDSLLSAIMDVQFIVCLTAIYCFLPCRTISVLIYHTLIILSFLIPHVLTALRVKEMLFVSLIRLFGLFIFSTLALLGRFFNEIKQRSLFFDWMIVRKELDKINEDARQKRKNKGFSAVEQLINILEEIKYLQLCAKTKFQRNASFLENEQSIVLLDKCLNDLTSTDDLYSLVLDKSLNQEYVRAFADDYRVKRKTSLTVVKEPEGKEYNKFSNKEMLYTKGSKQLEQDRVLESVFKQIYDKWAPYAQRIGKDWTFDILSVGLEIGNPLKAVGIYLLNQIPYLKANKNLNAFLESVESQYLPNPYHNSTHGAMVAHQTSCLLEFLGLKDKIDPLGLSSIYVATLCHDIGHPGRNNAFFVNTQQSIALVYNDMSVLENFHASLTFSILKRPELNIFSGIKDEDFKDIRRNLIEMILATDMKHHFDSISRFRIRRASSEFDFLGKSEDRWLVIKMCIKCADIGHGSVKWENHFEWSCRVIQEFYMQGDEELAYNTPISPLCNRANHMEMAKSQKGYLEFIVSPLVNELLEIEEESYNIEKILVKNIEENSQRWEEIANKSLSIEFPSSVVAFNDSTSKASKVDVKKFIAKFQN